MRTSSAAALLTAMVLGTAVPAPAPAHAQPPARASLAWVGSCFDSDRGHTPCNGWKLIAPGGRAITAKGIAVTGVDRRGRSSDEPAPLAISADGRSIAYQRTGDHRLVVWRLPTGRRTVLPKSLLPKGGATDGIRLLLSPAGDKVVVDHHTDDGRVPTKIYTLGTGRTTELRGGDAPIGFTPDGKQLLARRVTADNTVALVVHRPDGTILRRTPPQVVANSLVTAPAADGRTVAVVVAARPERDERPRVHLYDLRTGELADGVDLRLGRHENPFTARWEGRTLRLAVSGHDKRGVTVIREYTADPRTGAVKQVGRYPTGKDPYEYRMAGE